MGSLEQMENTQPPPWQEVASALQKQLTEKIPRQWRLKTAYAAGSNVTSVPETCNLLTARQLFITSLTASEILRKLHSRALTAVEVTEAFCGRAAIAHQLTNCLVDYFPSEALERARELDALLEKTGKPVGPLHGLPVAIKDMYDIAGRKTSKSFIAWANDPPATQDSSLVAVLREAGAIFYVKTHMPQTGMALETVSNMWGRTLNPYNTKLTSGGSSGGDAALLALKGGVICPSSDIGGSIRVPAAFNGLYSIRPSSERIPRAGFRSAGPGQTAIRVSCGPIAHSMEDIRMFTKIINAHPQREFEPGCIPIPWREVSPPREKMSFGFMVTDGVVDPHPPIQRAIAETMQKLKSAGHEVFEFHPPFDLWEAAVCTWKLYFQTGGAELKAVVTAGGEPLIPSLQKHLKIFDIKELKVSEVYKLNTMQSRYKAAFAKAWTETIMESSIGRTMDAMICPVAPCCSFPHDFPVWWGYSSLFNLLDYPSTTLPIKDFKVDAEKDKKDLDYQPRSNPFDAQNWEIYDFERYKNQPVALQLVGRPYHDEEIIAASQVVDTVCNRDDYNGHASL